MKINILNPNIIHIKFLIYCCLICLKLNIAFAQIEVIPKLDKQYFEANELKQLEVQNLKTDKVYLIWNNRFSSQILPATINENSLLFEIPAYLRQQSGQTEILLISAEKTIYKTSFYITSSKAVDIIDTYIGPKTISSDTLQPALVICIPKDEFQNPIDNEKLVDFNVYLPNKNSINTKEKMDNLVAYLSINPSEKKGKIIVGAQIDEAHCTEQEIEIEAGNPLKFDLNIIEQFPYADERQFTIINTDILKDKNGAIVAEGTNVDFIFKIDELDNSYKSYTVNGVATVAIQNPKKAGTYKVNAIIYPNIISSSLKLEYQSSLKEIIAETDNQSIFIGPIKSNFGQLYKNDALVKFNFNPGNYTFTKSLENGMAKLDIQRQLFDKDLPNNCTISIGDQEKIIQINLSE